MSRQVDCAGVDQIAALQHGRRQPQQKAQQLLVFRLVTQTEVIFEAHAGRNEIEQRHAHAERSGGDGGYSELGASGKHRAANVERKKIEPVHVHVDVAQKIGQVAGINAGGRSAQVELGVDVAGEAG